MTRAASQSSGKQGPNYPIESVDNVLRLLGLFSERSVLRLSEVSESLGVAASTAHRLVAMLLHHEYVEQDPKTRAYRAGPALIELGLTALRELDLAALIRPFMDEAVRRFDETVVLCVRFGDQVLIVDTVESSQPVRVGGRIGHKLPAHASAAGMALLSYLDDDRLQQIFPNGRMPSSQGGPTSRAQLASMLADVRSAGFAVDRGGAEASVSAVAANIVNRTGTIRAAMAVLAPIERLDGDAIAEVGLALSAICTEASRGLDRRSAIDN